MHQFNRGNTRGAKLTGEQVLMIRWRYFNERGCTQPMLSREYQVSVNTIANIVKGITWQNIAGHEMTGLDRPPPQAQPRFAQSDIEASVQRVQEMLASEHLGPMPEPGGTDHVTLERPLTRSLYEDPPPCEQHEVSEALQSRIERELAALRKPLDREVDSALDELTKETTK